MRKAFNLKAFAVVALASVSILSCKDDDETPINNVLITSERSTGQFYVVDQTTGTSTAAFKIDYDGSDLSNTRAFVYHPRANKFFVSLTTNSQVGQGPLFSVDVATKEATLINNNDGKVNDTDVNLSYDIWDAIVAWTVAEDDSLIAIGDFNDDGNGAVKFGTDGGRSLKTKQLNICCGMGMLYNASTGKLTIAHSNNSNDGEVIVEIFSASGVSEDEQIITDFEGFSTTDLEAIQASWLNVKAIAVNPSDANGTLFGILYVNNAGVSHLVKIDTTNSKVTYVSTLGTSSEEQYNTLAFIPENLAK